MSRRSVAGCLLCISVYYILNVPQKTIATLHINGTGNKTGSDTSQPSKIKRDDSVSSEPEAANGFPTQNATNNSPEMPPAERTKRRNVKLTMKQGLIMNQIMGIYAVSNTKNVMCKNHTDEFRAGLRAFESWALQMFDASSKIPAGILFGNVVEFGSFEQCVNIEKNSQYGLMRGKSCSVRVVPGEKLLQQIMSLRNVSKRRFNKVKSTLLDGIQLVWSVCIPHTCRANDILPHFNQSIKELTDGLDLDVELTDDNCSTLEEEGLDNYTLLSITVLLVIPLNVFIASLLEWKTGGTGSTYVDIFSVYSNGRRLFVRNETNSELDCLHGIRCLSICHVVFGHRFEMGMMFPSVNSLYLLDWVLEYPSTIVIGGTVCVDSFLFVSSTLVSYGFFADVEKRGKFNLAAFYLYRYLRISMSYAVVIFAYATLIHRLGSGPLWRDTASGLQKPCKYFWWSALLHTQSYVNPTMMCIVQTWYLSVEMLLYYMSPLILYPLWRWPSFGLANGIFLYILSACASFYMTWKNEYEGGMLLTRNLFDSNFFQHFYITPHTRASPYIIGLGFGYAIHKMRDRKVHLSPAINALGWTTSAAVMLSTVVGCHVFLEEMYEYNKLEACFYQTLARSGWVLGIAWMIWTCINGYGGIVNIVLSLHIFRVLGRVSYAMFLLHMGFQFVVEGAAKLPSYYSNFQMLYRCSADFGFVVIMSFIFTLLFELPFNNIIKFAFTGNEKSRTTPQPGKIKHNVMQ